MTVYLVGAGPGDPGLLTVRGAEVLAQADVVVHDRLVGKEILGLVPTRARLVDVGKQPGAGGRSQTEINRLLVDLGREERCVVRLKGGDPFVLGRGGEEVMALRAAGIDVVVVPGVTSAIAAPGAAGIPVTHRGRSSGFTVLTAHQDPESDQQPDWDALVRLGTTIVVLMGATLASSIAARLTAAGLSPRTPTAAIRNGTLPDQQIWRGPLAELGSTPLDPPVTIVIGAVAAEDLT